MNVVFSKSAALEFRKLSKNIQARVKAKLAFFSGQNNPLAFAKPMHDSDFGEYRFRVGDYRIIFDIINNSIFVLKVGHRREIYR